MTNYYKMLDSDGKELGRWVGFAEENTHRMGEEVNGDTVAEIIDDTFEPDLAAEARQQRNALLTASDWTQVADAPVDKAAWANYRQSLRDITQQACFPNDVTWPTHPE